MTIPEPYSKGGCLVLPRSYTRSIGGRAVLRFVSASSVTSARMFSVGQRSEPLLPELAADGRACSVMVRNGTLALVILRLVLDERGACPAFDERHLRRAAT